MRLTRYEPFHRLARLRDELDDFFGGANEDVLGIQAALPALELFENEDRFTVKAELPGMKKEDIQVSFHGSTLMISGERKADEYKEGEHHQTERWYGQFQRTVELPHAIDETKISANYEDGVLCIYLPKSEEVKPRKIEIKDQVQKAKQNDM